MNFVGIIKAGYVNFCSFLSKEGSVFRKMFDGRYKVNGLDEICSQKNWYRNEVKEQYGDVISLYQNELGMSSEESVVKLLSFIGKIEVHN
ncbi:hypothetical protein FHS18_001151 [Paenibacillus phyllosphaerae]|uniref:Uncharacterized protein n=1 Tax=Paenibacillus phyllosphaerae TaxID=274593 RepID=A0A7W5AUN9_9BACL|nr:hypothetical protein [Paenibacillus phyllosphaerae]MBB3109099.1 hypothetical protein [Paenibacillus phyllosphaerae]